MTAAEAVTPTTRQLLRRARFWIVIAVVVVVIAVGSAVLNAVPGVGRTFDPANPAPEGALALRSVLEQQGVQLTVASATADAVDARGTLFVDDTDATISSASWRRLIAGRSRVVVVAPDRTALDALLPEASQAGEPDAKTAAAGCDLALAKRAGSMSLTGVALTLRSTADTVCFRTAAGAGQLVRGTANGVQVTLLADRTAFTNEHIASAGNAAVALNVLGAAGTLVWFQQSPLDPARAGTKTLQDLTPPWVTPLVVLLLLAGFATTLWKGRRLGPIVIEALPVVVRSRETVEGRARLYDRGRARLRAADSLRMGVVGRMAPLLGLPRSASVDEVVDAAARLTNGHRDRVAAVLLTEEPATDRDLVRISDDLARLEAAVRAATLLAHR